MKVGLIARADDRGIGYQTLEFFRHMQPDRTAVVSIRQSKWPEHLDRFPGAARWWYDGKTLDEQQCRRWLHGLDVVFAVETVYDWRFAAWCRMEGVRLVVQGNPEFWKPEQKPDVWWWPTDWLIQQRPKGPIVPVPAPDNVRQVASSVDRLHVLHVAGHRAIGDRNGTELLYAALRLIKRDVKVTVIGQDGQLPQAKVAPNVELVEHPSGVADRWDLYVDQHVLVLPRRYGGLCLPAIEAMASGLGLVMPGWPPNRMWPILEIPAAQGPSQRTPSGHVRTCHVSPRQIAEQIGLLEANRPIRDAVIANANGWYAENCWSKQKPLYLARLEEALQ